MVPANFLSTYISIVSMVELMKKASERIPNFVGLKFTSRDCAEAGSCLLLKRPNGKPFKFFFGSDETYLGHYAFGIESAIGSSYNFVPQLFHQINKAVADNDIKKARELQFVNTNMFEILFKNGNYFSRKKRLKQESIFINSFLSTSFLSINIIHLFLSIHYYEFIFINLFLSI